MNLLDDLLGSTGRVEDITPNGMRNARAALDSTIRGARTRHAPARQSANRRSARPRGKIIVAGTAATAAAVAVAVVPRLSGQRPVPAHPAPAHSTAVTAAFVLREAANATKANPQQEGWPRAAYWHVASIEVRDGKTDHRNIWIAHNGDAVLEDSFLPLPPGPQPVHPAGSGLGTSAASQDG
jgi:hypothetical protein